MCFSLFFSVFFSSRIRHTRCALVTGVQTCALPISGYGNIATAVAAVKVGATDYLPKPTDADQVEAALLERGEILPPPPCNPMSADRVRWEHIQRVYEHCDRNVSETARRRRMHRRPPQLNPEIRRAPGREREG